MCGKAKIQIKANLKVIFEVYETMRVSLLIILQAFKSGEDEEY